MGLRLRKSVRIGPFRLNLSKSGVGASVGVPGNRVTLRADGRVQHSVGIPGTGVSFQKTLARAAHRTIAAPLPYHPNRPATLRPMSLGTAFLAYVMTGLGCVMLAAAAKGAGSWVEPLMSLGMIAGLISAIVLYVRSKKRTAERNAAAHEGYVQQLIDRFGEDVARKMFVGDPWQGASQEMIRVMYGAPHDVSTKVHKATTQEMWKYVPLDARRYALRIEFENGVCVGWQTA